MYRAREQAAAFPAEAPPPLAADSAAADALAKILKMDIAVVHDWCPSFRGGERVLARICALTGARDIFTLVNFLPDHVIRDHFSHARFHTSFVDRLPLASKIYRSFFFLAPLLVEQFNVTEYDAVISSSAAFARGVITRPDQLHLCYVHSPARYAWDEQFSYLGRLPFGPKRMLFRYLLHHLRIWDARTAHGPDLMIANSQYVRTRIQKIYGRDADVIYPPVDIRECEYCEDKDDYYVAASFLAPYKRPDLIVRAFNDMPSRRLLVVGEGQEQRALEKIAGSNITFAGYLPRAEYIRTVARARALVFAGCEDFGIAMAEAQACGTPVIAYGRGGALEIVRRSGEPDGPTGVVFEKQTVQAVKDAIDKFEANQTAIKPSACRVNALRFSPERFDREMVNAFDAAMRLQQKRSGRFLRSASMASTN